MILFQYLEDENNNLHIEKHAVCQEEIQAILLKNKFHLEFKRNDNSFEAIGKHPISGRYLKIIYRKTKAGNDTTYFIITAYDLNDQIAINIVNKYIDK